MGGLGARGKKHRGTPGIKIDVLDMVRVQGCRYRVPCPRFMPFNGIGKEKEGNDGGGV
jgi:hypothetical protein